MADRLIIFQNSRFLFPFRASKQLGISWCIVSYQSVLVIFSSLVDLDIILWHFKVSQNAFVQTILEGVYSRVEISMHFFCCCCNSISLFFFNVSSDMSKFQEIKFQTPTNFTTVLKLRKMFFRLVTSVGQRKILSPHDESNLRPSDLRSNVLPLSHKDSSVSGVYYEVLMTHILHTARTSNVDSVMFLTEKQRW